METDGLLYGRRIVFPRGKKQSVSNRVMDINGHGATKKVIIWVAVTNTYVSKSLTRSIRTDSIKMSRKSGLALYWDHKVGEVISR